MDPDTTIVINNALSLATTQPAVARGVRQSMALRSTVAHYWALTKPEVNLLIGIATGAGFYLALGRLHDFPLLQLFNTLCGTLLIASGTGSLNQFVERRFDAQMRRTNRRPLAAGRLGLFKSCASVSDLLSSAVFISR